MNLILNKLASPKEDTATMTIRLPQSAIDKLNAICDNSQNRFTKNALVGELVLEGLKALPTEPPANAVAKSPNEFSQNALTSPVTLNAQLAAIYGKEKISNDACAKYASEARQALGIDKKDNTAETKKRIVEWHKQKQAT